MSVQAKAFGTADCPKCATKFDVISGAIKDQQAAEATKRKLTPGDVLFRFIIGTLGLSVVLGVLKEILAK